VTIGEALAEARNRAGLSVDEVSERTRIRETVIRSIEQDDYGACGGDLYVRGYVRAIANVVGIDAQPLIREHDLARAEEPDRAEERELPAPGLFGPEPEPDTPEMITPELVASEPLTPEPQPPLVTAAMRETPTRRTGKPRPRRPAQTQPAWKARVHSQRWAAGVAALAVVVLAAAGFAGSHIVSSLHSVPAAQQTTRHGAPAKTAKTAKGKTGKAATVNKAGPHKAARKAAASSPSRPLPIALAEAFGPDGTADGDNPQGASFAITPGAPRPWQTDWYTTANFGQLKQGTGLLLDMGSTVTITSVRIDLGAATGADLQLRVGGTPVPGGLRVVASASNAGGTLDLTLAHPARARYILVWFTLLPQNAAGQYQASVYQAGVSGVH
jgi:transcriptional regulator with XRE-family HTH domain